MNTETTETDKAWVFYDADCPLCRGWAERTHLLLLRRGYHLVPLQAPWVRRQLGLSDNRPLPEMKLQTAEGRIFGGADALIQIAGSIWWAWPIYIAAQIPGIKPWLHLIYCRLAANRHCLGNKCQAPSHRVVHGRNITSAFYQLP